MREQYIPDLTERFPEGFGGIDRTDSYFNEPRRDYISAMYEYERDLYEKEMAKIRDRSKGGR